MTFFQWVRAEWKLLVGVSLISAVAVGGFFAYQMAKDDTR